MLKPHEAEAANRSALGVDLGQMRAVEPILARFHALNPQAKALVGSQLVTWAITMRQMSVTVVSLANVLETLELFIAEREEAKVLRED